MKHLKNINDFVDENQSNAALAAATLLPTETDRPVSVGRIFAHEPMTVVGEDDTYKYYVGVDDGGKRFYNVVPKEQNQPQAGYYNKNYILGVKKAPDIFFTEDNLKKFGV